MAEQAQLLDLHRCRRCGLDKLRKDFHRDTRRPQGHRDVCKDCQRAYTQSRKALPEVQEYHRLQSRKHYGRIRSALRRRKYGIHDEELRALVRRQDGRCAICGREPERRTVLCQPDPLLPTGLHIDHDHETGRVRGLLCGPCNRALGQFQESAEVLSSAISYLNGGNG